MNKPKNAIDNDLIRRADELYCRTNVDIRSAYDQTGVIPTSDNADAVLIVYQCKYWGFGRPDWISRSRGHSMRVSINGSVWIAKVIDPYDYRDGVEFTEVNQ